MKTKPMTNSVLMVLLLAAVLCSTASAGTMAWWRFENSPASEVNSPAMDLTLGSTVTYGTNVPGTLAGSIANTGTYVHGTGTYSSFDGGAAALNAVVCNADFTLESFVYVNPGATIAWEQIIGTIDGASGWSMWMHHDNHGAREVFFYGYRGNQPASTFYLKSGISLIPGLWYHVAVVGTTYDMGASPDRQHLEMFINYEFVASLDLYAPAGTEGPGIVGPFIVEPTGTASYIGANNPFEGSFDEIRISDTALATAQFLHTDPELSIPDLTAAWWRFENDTTSEYNNAALEMSPSPTYSYVTDVAGAYVNGQTNTAAYRHGTSTQPAEVYDYDVINTAMSGDFTLELLVRPSLGDYSTYSPFLSNLTSGAGFTFCMGWPGASTTGQVAFRAIQSADSSEKRTASGVTLIRGVWNHIAAVGMWTGTTMGVQLYVNYQPAGSPMLLYGASGQTPIKMSEEFFVMGALNPFNGDVDEMRITAAKLEPDQFLHADSNPQSCQEAILLGYQMAEDFDGDCDVNLSDFTVLADNWLVGNPIVTEPYPMYCGDKGALGQTTYYASAITTAMTIDGDLSEWPAFDYDPCNWCANDWYAVDMIYSGYEAQNVSEAYMCLMYDPCDDFIYGAVKLNDTDTVYHTYSTWDGQDDVEIYCKGDPNLPGEIIPDASYDDYYDVAQQYMVGLKSDLTSTWMTYGVGVSWEVSPQWDPGLEAAVVRTPNGGGYDEVTYEFKVVPYTYFGRLVEYMGAIEQSDLFAGKEVGFDLVISDKGDGNFGMLCPNAVGGKSSNYTKFSTMICQ